MNRNLWNWAAVWSMSGALALCGCGGSEKPVVEGGPPVIGHEGGDAHEDAHASEGPHHGHLIELGKEDYHAELIHEESTHEVIVFVLDSAAKERVPIEAKELLINISSGKKPTQYSLSAAPDAVDPGDKSSRFMLRSEDLCDSICASGAKGRVNITINGKTYSGAIEHVAHAGHEHAHGHKH